MLTNFTGLLIIIVNTLQNTNKHKSNQKQQIDDLLSLTMKSPVRNLPGQIKLSATSVPNALHNFLQATDKLFPFWTSYQRQYLKLTSFTAPCSPCTSQLTIERRPRVSHERNAHTGYSRATCSTSRYCCFSLITLKDFNSFSVQLF